MGRKNWIALAFLVGVGLFLFKQFRPAKTGLADQGPPPDVELLNDDGLPVRLSELLKEKPKSIVNMWASWCEPCVQEMPEINKAVSRFEAEQTQVILINYDGGSPERVVPQIRAWMITQGLDHLRTYFDFPEGVLKALNVSTLPFTFAVGAGPRIQWSQMGELEWKDSSVSVK